MTKKYLTKKQQEQLKCNPNVQAVSEKAITYTDQFKRHFIARTKRVNNQKAFSKKLD